MNVSQRKLPIVAIDGPAGAGKSTVAREVARTLGYTRVDTGALYRAVAWHCMERGIGLSEAQRVEAAAAELTEPGAIEMSTDGEQSRLFVLGKDVSREIRSREASLGASVVSQLPGVRAALLSMQRSLGERGGVVIEGRDIGSVVFPDAEAKFFLTASAEVRAERRQAELAAKGEAPSLQEIIAEVNERDRRDTERPIAPLVQAPDAVVVDSSRRSIDEVVREIVARVLAISSQT